MERCVLFNGLEEWGFFIDRQTDSIIHMEMQRTWDCLNYSCLLKNMGIMNANTLLSGQSKN